MLFSLGTLDVLISRNLWNYRVGVERLDPPNDLHVFLGPWMVVLSKAPTRHRK